MTILISASPQYYSPPIECSSNEILFVFPLEPKNNIKNPLLVVVLNTQIFVLSAENFAIVEEVVLEAPIAAFKFFPEEFKLILKLHEEGHEDDSILPNIITITTKSGTWALDAPQTGPPVICFTLLETGAVASAIIVSEHEEPLQELPSPINEVILGDLVAALKSSNTENSNPTINLELLDKSTRARISSVQLKLDSADIRAKSIIWSSDKSISFFYISPAGHSLKIQKFLLVQFTKPTNGCNLPLVAWCEEAIYAHRAGVICPKWFSLKNSEVWDCFESQVGTVDDIQVSADGSCLFVSGFEGAAFCDFIKRSWNRQPLPDQVIQSKWLGNDHVVALLPGALVLISRHSHVVMKIPVESPEQIKFIDTYNTWQLIIQSDKGISVFAFDCEDFKFTLRQSISFAVEDALKQAVQVGESIFILSHTGTLAVLENSMPLPLCESCVSFIVLSTGHFLVMKQNGSLALLKDSCETSLMEGCAPLLAALPFSNCFTLLLQEHENFNILVPLQSRFLLPDLFRSGGDVDVLSAWIEDPMYPLALEYILLDCSNGALPALDQMHRKSRKLARIFARALVSISRKMEVHQVSQNIFHFLPSFSPDALVQILLDKPHNDEDKSTEDSNNYSNVDNINYSSNEDNDNLLINFLPYFAKSYFEEVNDRKNSITTLLLAIFSHRRMYNRIGTVREYLAAFADLKGLFESTLHDKITSLWNSGRKIKAFLLLEASTDNEPDIGELIDRIPCFVDDSVDVNELVLKLDVLACSDRNVFDKFRAWLITRQMNKTLQLLDLVGLCK